MAVSNAYSLFDRAGEKACPSTQNKTVAKSNKAGVINLCAATKLSFLAYAPLGGLQARDGRRDLPNRFEALESLAQRHHVSIHVLALAFLRCKWPAGTIIPLVGMRSEAHLSGLTQSLTINLSAIELEEIESLVGNRKRKR